jgi:hypothetical protein
MTTTPPAQPAEPKYIDRPEISEVYADRLEHVFFDGLTLRLEFTVTRTEADQGTRSGAMKTPKRWAYTSARVVMSGRSVVQMLNKMLELQALMTEHGLVETRRRDAESS